MMRTLGASRLNRMNEQLAYLKAVVEGAPGIEPWAQWFRRNSGELSLMLTRSEYLRLKRHRIKAIPEILERFSVAFSRSERYAWLSGVEGLCRDCGDVVVETGGGGSYCPRGCYRLRV